MTTEHMTALVALGVRYGEAQRAVHAVTGEIRAAALLALAAGMTPGQVSALTGIQAGTVRRWRTEARAAKREPVSPANGHDRAD